MLISDQHEFLQRQESFQDLQNETWIVRSLSYFLSHEKHERILHKIFDSSHLLHVCSEDLNVYIL